jgi:hypothetical protein
MIYITSNERLEDEIDNLWKIKDEAGGREQELALPSKNTDETCVTGTVEAGIYIGTFCPGWWSQPGLKDQTLVPIGVKTRDKRPTGPLIPISGSNRD